MNDDPTNLHQFGNCRLDSAKKVLWFGDEPVPLPLKAVELLSLLVTKGGEVVTKDEIWQTVWQDSFVEETNLTHNIYLLRRTFKDLGEADPIQTVPRRGYRFAGQLMLAPKDDLVIERHSIVRTLVEELPGAGDIAPRELGMTHRRRALVAGGMLALVLTGVAFAIWSFRTGTSAATAAPIRSVAVLPVVPITGDREDAALGLGIADALITRLGKVNEIRIVSTSTASRYTDTSKQPIDIGKELGVDGVLEGTLQRSNGKLRVTLRLFRTSDGVQVWSGLISDSESEIFRLQDSVAFQTAQALNLNLKTGQELKRPTGNLEAYNQYLKGDFLFRRRGFESVSASLPFFKEAVRLDPNFARAWAGWAAVVAMGTDIPQAEALVSKALELDAELAEAHATRGFIQMFHYWNWVEAEKSLNRAIELDPNSLQAHHWRGVYLTFHGRFDEARAEMERALELDPVSLNIHSDLGQLYYYREEFDRAEEYCNRALAIDPGYGLAHAYLFKVFESQRDYDKAFRHFTESECGVRDAKARKECMDPYQDAYDRGGWSGVTEVYAATLKTRVSKAANAEHRSAAFHGLALFSLSSGDTETALRYLNSSIDSKVKYETMNFTFPYLKVDPQLKPLRSDTRFHDILKRINL